jgi:arylsulfatase A-like enzyme
LKPPNILFITSDQQHWRALGRNNPELLTPHLDKLAADGVYCERAYCPNPTCTPSRASMLTGQYPSRHGAWSLGTKLPETAITVGELLQNKGYDSTLIGKAHFQPLVSTPEFLSLESYPLLRDLEFWRNFHGPFYGFNHLELARNHADEAHVGQHYALWMEEKGLKNWRDHFQNVWGKWDFSEGMPNPAQWHSWSLPEEFHQNSWITERSIARMRKCKQNDQPFFLWASFFDPHPPYLVPEPWASMYDPATVTVPALVPGEHDRNPPHFRMTQESAPDFSAFQETPHFNHGCHSHLHSREELAKNIAVYYGMTSMMDRSIGKLLNELQALDLEEETLVVFTSDHGHFHGHHGLVAKGPFLYEDEVRVPLIARWPGRIPPRQQTDSLVSLIDLPVSFLRAAGERIPSVMQGVDQLDVWCGTKIRARDHVLVENRHQPTAIHQKSYISARHKLTIYYNQPFGELFDLVDDPGELNNLWNNPGSQSLKNELTRALLFADMGSEPLWMPRVSGA